jgi:hypothetical protein
MLPSICNFGHALPLTFVRFSRFALRRADRRTRYAFAASSAAIGDSFIASRNCDCIRNLQASRSASHRNFYAARHTASGTAHPLHYL